MINNSLHVPVSGGIGPEQGWNEGGTPAEQLRNFGETKHQNRRSDVRISCELLTN